jgi:hypothetical protein
MLNLILGDVYECCRFFTENFVFSETFQNLQDRELYYKFSTSPGYSA